MSTPELHDLPEELIHDVADPELTPPKRKQRHASRGRLIWYRLRATPRFWVGFAILVFMFIFAWFGHWLSDWGPLDQDRPNASRPPTSEHFFGTDNIGRDVYTRTVYGLRTSLVIGLIAGPLATLIAAVVGATAGLVGGITDRILSWFINLMLVFPAFFLMIMLSPIFQRYAWIVLTFFIAGTGWMIMAQVVRSQTIALRDREFVKAARFMGVGTPTIMRRHIIPNVASLLIIHATLGVVAAIMAETALSYFGFGIRPPDISLGMLLNEGTRSATTRSWLFIYPAGILVTTLLSISLIGDALRDAVDPTSGVVRD